MLVGCTWYTAAIRQPQTKKMCCWNTGSVTAGWADRLRLAQSPSLCGSTGTGWTPPTPFHVYGYRLV